MKVYKEKEEKFRPIIISLETEEEAENLCHLLNVNYEQSLDDYCDQKGLSVDEMTCFCKDMLGELHNLIHE